MLTGVRADRHGVIANGFYYRDRREVALWTGSNDVIEAPPLWGRLAGHDPPITSAAWHAQNIKGAEATYIITPAPVHQPDGSEKPWCYAKPPGLYEELLAELGGFPLQHYWGPLAGLASSEWIVRAASWVIGRYGPDFSYVYIPHLDYAMQKVGPDAPAATDALRELDGLVGEFFEAVSRTEAAENTAWLIAGEYAMTEVSGAVFPNRILREAGLLRVRESEDGEVIDFASSAAFAMVDHQFAHVFVQDASKVEAAAACFRGVDGIDAVLVDAGRGELHMDHPRSGEILLVSHDDRWLAYYWWLEDSSAPRFARTVDIHRKPGYDPVELFFDPATRSIPLDASLVKASHGVPCTGADHETVVIASDANLLAETGEPVRDTDLCGVILQAFDEIG